MRKRTHVFHLKYFFQYLQYQNKSKSLSLTGLCFPDIHFSPLPYSLHFFLLYSSILFLPTYVNTCFRILGKDRMAFTRIHSNNKATTKTKQFWCPGLLYITPRFLSIQQFSQRTKILTFLGKPIHSKTFSSKHKNGHLLGSVV